MKRAVKQPRPPRDGTIVGVRAAPGDMSRGVLWAGGRAWLCALGATGMTVRKREGDGGTPIGRWRLRELLFRPDRLRRPRTGLPVRAIARDAGWCDDAHDRNYNRPVRLPYGARAERLWREDGLYDLVVVLDYNLHPRAKGRGSAIFVHVAQDGHAPTQGCVALARGDLLALLSICGPGSAIDIR